jgi:hypothetical protein
VRKATAGRHPCWAISWHFSREGSTRPTGNNGRELGGGMSNLTAMWFLAFDVLTVIET